MSSHRGFQFDSSLSQWEPAFDSPEFSGDSLSVATWNVWFGEYGFEERAGALLAELERRCLDIVALQEVTPRLLKIITACDWVREFYTLSEVEPAWMGDYGCLFLSRRAPSSVRRFKLPGVMKRYALLADFATSHGPLTVVTVHLESMGFQHQVRGEQLQEIFWEMETATPVIFMGDFNFCSSNRPENDRLDRRYLDLWPVLHPELPGYTEDTTINSMRLAQKGKEKHVRYDRILLRDDRRRWSPCTIELLGTQPIEPELFVSDHFGLLASFTGRSVKDDLLLMLGHDHLEYGKLSHGSLGPVTACLSVGADLQSPSLAFKADKGRPNEDALLVKRQGDLYLLAVADSHFGLEASHRLLERLAEREFPSLGPGEEGARMSLMELCLQIQRPHEQAMSGTTLIVALYHARTGRVLALATGDSTLATLSKVGWTVHNQHNNEYVRLDRLSYPDVWEPVELTLEPGALLVLHTDGIDECHYRKPETSLRPLHIESLWGSIPQGGLERRASRFTTRLAQTALEGVDGHPGGQDNMALLVLSHGGGEGFFEPVVTRS